MLYLHVQFIHKVPRLDPYDSIKSIGGYLDGKIWRLSQQEAVARILRQEISCYVGASVHRQVPVVVRSRYPGRYYLTTEPDGWESNNLLSLPEFPRQHSGGLLSGFGVSSRDRMK
jgi:hypothetical protein